MADSYGGSKPAQTGFDDANFRTDVQFGHHTPLLIEGSMAHYLHFTPKTKTTIHVSARAYLCLAYESNRGD
jgi:hypothetical protein